MTVFGITEVVQGLLVDIIETRVFFRVVLRAFIRVVLIVKAPFLYCFLSGLSCCFC
jgi:hypothetical protein